MRRVRLMVVVAACVLAVACEGAAPEHAWLETHEIEGGARFERTADEGYATLGDRMFAGVCVLDLDGEAPLDLFFAGRRSGTRLWRGVGDLAYEDATSELGDADVIPDALSCLAVDLEGDGDDDLVVGAVGGAHVFLREGGAFEQRDELLPIEVPARGLIAGIAAGDVDGDLDLDLVIAGFLDADSAPTENCEPLACGARLERMQPLRSWLLLREGDAYVDRTAELAPDLLEAEPTLLAAIVDLDGDGASEIFVGNDLGDRFRDRLLVRRPDGTFRDEAWVRGVSANARGHGIDSMGVAFGDVDLDGRIDLAQTAFESWPTALFVCGEDDFCEERGAFAGLAPSTSGLHWGIALADLDLDGDLDLFQAAGHVYTDDELVALGLTSRHAQRPELYEGAGDGSFRAVSPRPESALAAPLEGRGLAIADLDDDGDLDVVVATTRGAPALLRNVREREGHFLRVALIGRAPNRAAIGARVEVTSDDRTRVRLRLAGEGYLGSFDPRLHFGVPGDAPVTVRVSWPSGATSEQTLDALDREITLREP